MRLGRRSQAHLRHIQASKQECQPRKLIVKLAECPLETLLNISFLCRYSSSCSLSVQHFRAGVLPISSLWPCSRHNDLPEPLPMSKSWINGDQVPVDIIDCGTKYLDVLHIAEKSHSALRSFLFVLHDRNEGYDPNHTANYNQKDRVPISWGCINISPHCLRSY